MIETVARPLFFLSVGVLLLPHLVSAQTLPEAICKQVLEPKDGATVAGIVGDYLLAKAKEIPSALLSSAKSAGDAVANTLADKLEASKKGSALAAGAKVPLSQTIYNDAADGGSFLLRHWLASLVGGLGAFSLLFFI